MRRKMSITFTVFVAALIALGPLVSAHHVTRTDDRIVEPYGIPVLMHIPIVAGYEPVPTPQHCLPGQSTSGIVYSEDFEGTHGYEFVDTPLAPGTENLWNVTDFTGEGPSTGHSSPNRLYFGVASGSSTYGLGFEKGPGTYDVSSGHVAGTARSPTVSIPSGEAYLTFATKWNVEWLKGDDHMWVEAEDSSGTVHLLCTANAYDRGDATSAGDFHGVGSCSPLHFNPCPPQVDPKWEQRTVEIPNSLLGEDVQLRFTFDTSDHAANDFMGWMIDDVRVGTSIT